jgi:hypothetical protein
MSASAALNTTASPGNKKSEKTGTASIANPNPVNARIKAAKHTDNRTQIA